MKQKKREGWGRKRVTAQKEEGQNGRMIRGSGRTGKSRGGTEQ